MGLREEAAADLQAILEDLDGFGWPLTLTTPAGASAALTGMVNDISQVIDPDTGQAINGRTATAVLRTASVLTALGAIPSGVVAATAKPWTVAFNDVDGTTHTFKVREANPDRTLGSVILVLEVYTPL